MPNNPFQANEETSFEQGTPVTKPVKAATGKIQQQAKAFTDDFLEQLYGPSKPTAKPVRNASQSDAGGKEQEEALKQKEIAPPKPKPYIMGGTANVGDHAKYAAREQLLAKGDSKAAGDVMHHMQYYFDSSIGTLEDNAKKARNEEEQKKQKKLQEEEEEKKKKAEEETKRNAEIPRAVAKGRNRMMGPGGKKPKTPMSVQMGQMKTEAFRGSSG